ncbi:MAG: hypothetical protein AAF228_06780 [Pseudomonadota bacterium]
MAAGIQSADYTPYKSVQTGPTKAWAEAVDDAVLVALPPTEHHIPDCISIGSSLSDGQSLLEGQALFSEDGLTRLILDAGKLVLQHADNSSDPSVEFEWSSISSIDVGVSTTEIKIEAYGVIRGYDSTGATTQALTMLPSYHNYQGRIGQWLNRDFKLELQNVADGGGFQFLDIADNNRVLWSIDDDGVEKSSVAALADVDINANKDGIVDGTTYDALVGEDMALRAGDRLVSADGKHKVVIEHGFIKRYELDKTRHGLEWQSQMDGNTELQIFNNGNLETQTGHSNSWGKDVDRPFTVAFRKTDNDGNINEVNGGYKMVIIDEEQGGEIIWYETRTHHDDKHRLVGKVKSAPEPNWDIPEDNLSDMGKFLSYGETMKAGDYLRNGNYRLVLRPDERLVLYYDDPERPGVPQAIKNHSGHHGYGSSVEGGFIYNPFVNTQTPHATLQIEDYGSFWISGPTAYGMDTYSWDSGTGYHDANRDSFTMYLDVETDDEGNEHADVLFYDSRDSISKPLWTYTQGKIANAHSNDKIKDIENTRKAYENDPTVLYITGIVSAALATSLAAAIAASSTSGGGMQGGAPVNPEDFDGIMSDAEEAARQEAAQALADLAQQGVTEPTPEELDEIMNDASSAAEERLEESSSEVGDPEDAEILEETAGDLPENITYENLTTQLADRGPEHQKWLLESMRTTLEQRYFPAYSPLSNELSFEEFADVADEVITQSAQKYFDTLNEELALVESSDWDPINATDLQLELNEINELAHQATTTADEYFDYTVNAIDNIINKSIETDVGTASGAFYPEITGKEITGLYNQILENLFIPQP